MSQERNPNLPTTEGQDIRSSGWISSLFLKTASPVSHRKVGLEVERLAVGKDLSPFRYFDKPQQPGAETLLKTLAKTKGWEGVLSPSRHLIGLKTGNGSVSLEPGSQVELSLNPLPSIWDSIKGIEAFENEVSQITKPWGVKWLGIGVNPFHEVKDIELIPVARYGIMTDYFGKSGRLGTAMMRLTTSIQVNLDYSSEAEAIEMFRVALCASPISYLLFSNSPFFNKKPTEFLSFRSEIWRNTDPYRAGLLPEAFQEGFNFKKYAEYLWARPLMFAQDAGGNFIPAHGKSLLEVSKEKNPSFPIDENNQWNTVRELFTEARLKPGYVEVRNIDGQLPAYRNAAAAFWVGLLYGTEARKLAYELLGKKDSSTKEKLWKESAKPNAGPELWEIAQTLVKAARKTLVERGLEEEKLLTPLEEVLKTKKSPGALLLEKGFDRVVESTLFPQA